MTIPSRKFKIRHRHEVKNFCLITNRLGNNDFPRLNKQIEQRLIILGNGQIWLTCYSLGSFDQGYRLIKKERIFVDKQVIKEIFSAVARTFYDNYLEFGMKTNDGLWHLKLTDIDNQEVIFKGSLSENTLHDLANLIRRSLKREDLWLFDGAPDSVKCLQIKYEYRENAEFKYREKLTVNQSMGSIEYFRQVADKYDCCYQLHDLNGITDFLDQLDFKRLSKIMDMLNETNSQENSGINYQVVMTTKQERDFQATGNFDQGGLPEDWLSFVAKLQKFLVSYGIVELFSPRTYGWTFRQNHDLIFCNVTFNAGGREYCYLADEDYQVGDLVVVPAGVDNHEVIVEVSSIEYHPASEAPYPLDKIKKVLHKFKNPL